MSLKRDRHVLVKIIQDRSHADDLCDPLLFKIEKSDGPLT